MMRLIAARNLTLKPWRSVFLLFGFSMGVAVMIVLLSIGEALLDQSKDERLVGGGEITVLPEGVDRVVKIRSLTHVGTRTQRRTRTNGNG